RGVTGGAARRRGHCGGGGILLRHVTTTPWPLRRQSPPPPIMVPGTASPETVVWAAQHRYPYIVLGSFLEQTQELIQIYRETAEAEGYEMQPEHIGYLIRCFVADTHEKAQEQGKNFFWQN